MNIVAVNSNRVDSGPGRMSTVTSGQRPAGGGSAAAGMVLPEDVVNLSYGITGDPAVSKRTPSVPVSTVERRALQESFSMYA